MKLIKQHFPIFDKYPDLIYLDNAATTQRPIEVIDRVSEFLSFENANIHRGIYNLSNKATSNYEAVRVKVAKLLNAPTPKCIGFTSGTTDGVNIIAKGFLSHQLQEGDNILISLSEHHGNFIPWQQLALERKAELRVIPINSAGDIELTEVSRLIDDKTKLISIQHISNTLGSVHDIQSIIDLAHSRSVKVMIDAAQSAALYDLNWQELKYDFLVFSGHKVFAPFGVGILFSAPNHHEQIRPYRFGGGIIKDVQLEDTTFGEFPHILDVGTPNVSGVIGLGAAMDFLDGLDRNALKRAQEVLIQYAIEKLKEFDQIQLVGNPRLRSGIISFNISGVHPHEVASFLNQDSIAVRAGMHCTQPLLDHLKIPATVRLSTSIYNTKDEIDQTITSIRELIRFWS